MRSSLCNSDHCSPHGHLRSSPGRILKGPTGYGGRILCCPHGSTDGRIYFLPPAHHRRFRLNCMAKAKARCRKRFTQPSNASGSLGKTLLLRSLLCRHYLSAPPGNRESDGTIDAKTNLLPSGPVILHCHFGLRTESRHRCGSAHMSKRKDP